MSIEAFIHDLPERERHVHIEGALEPELALKLAKPHHIDLPFEDEAAWLPGPTNDRYVALVDAALAI